MKKLILCLAALVLAAEPAMAASRRPACFPFGQRDDSELKAMLTQIAAGQQQILSNQQMILMLLQREHSAPAQPQIIVLGPGLDSAPRQNLPATPPKLELPATPPKIDLPAAPPKIDLPVTPPRQDLPATPPRQPAQVQTYSKAIWRPVQGR